MLREALLKLSKHTFTYAAAEQLQRLTGFLLVPLFTAYLTEADYGSKELFGVTIALAAQLAGINLTNAMSRHYFDGADARRRHLVVSTTWLTVASTSAAIALLLLGGSFGWEGRPPLETDDFAHAFRLALAIFWFQMLREVLGRYLQTEQRSLAFSVFAYCKLALELALQIVFVAGLRRGLVGAFEAVLIAEALAATALALHLLPRIGLGFSREVARGLWAFAGPLVPHGLMAFFLHSGDRFLLRAWSTAEDVGIYALAYKFGYISNYALLGPFLSVWYPYVFSLRTREEQQQLVARLTPYFLAMSGAVTLAVALFSREVIELAARRDGFHAAATAVPWIALGYWFWSWFQLAQTGFYVAKSTASLPWLTAAAAGANLLLNAILIPRYGFLGAAIATAVTFALLAALTARSVQRVFPHAVAWRRVAVPGIAGVVAFAAACGLERADLGPAWIGKAFLLLAWGASAWFGGLLPAEERRELVGWLRARMARK